MTDLKHKNSIIGLFIRGIFLCLFFCLCFFPFYDVSAFNANLEPPLILEFPDRLKFGEKLVIEGTCFYPENLIRIFIRPGEEEPIVGETKTDQEGGWTYTHSEPITEGDYLVWAVALDEDGRQSRPSNRVALNIASASFFHIFRGAPAVIILLLLIIFTLLIFIAIQKIRLKAGKRNVRQKTAVTDKNISHIFAALRQEAKKEIGQEKAVKKITEALVISEKFIKKEIKEIENKLK